MRAWRVRTLTIRKELVRAVLHAPRELPDPRSLPSSTLEYYGRERSKHWRAAAAGAAAGPAILLTGQTQTSLAVYIFLRSLVLLSRCALVSAQPPSPL
jgi:hypothetical protein